mmetsp:Transcript_8547/g.14412  ORF Transcript_8547/g.14412 Transcript_8547/m.14412 type:complete len:217 (+) Transcript_8547:1394-2044(+)
MLLSLLDDLIDVEDLDVGLLSVLLDRLVELVHGDEVLDGLGLALGLEQDDLAELGGGAGDGGDLCLADDEFNGLGSEGVVEGDGCSFERGAGEVGEDPLGPVLGVDAHEVPGAALGLHVGHHVQRLDSPRQVGHILVAILVGFPHVGPPLLLFVPAAQEVLVSLGVHRVLEGVDQGLRILIEGSGQLGGVAVDEGDEVLRVALFLGALDKAGVLTR